MDYSLLKNKLFGQHDCPSLISVGKHWFLGGTERCDDIILVTQLEKISIQGLEFWRPSVGLSSNGNTYQLKFWEWSAVPVHTFSESEREHFLMINPHITREIFEKECKLYPPPPGSSILLRVSRWLRRKYGLNLER